MPLEYTSRKVGPVFFVALAGTVDLDAAREAYDRVLRDCVDGGCTLLLVDARGAEGELSTVERFDFGKHVADRNAAAEGDLGLTFRVALVARVPLADPEHFGALVANNRGGKIKVTDQVEDAFDWFGITPLDGR